jgi:hypothetical protein
MKALGQEPGLEVGDEGCLAAHEMGAAGDVHEQAMVTSNARLRLRVRTEPDQRSVAFAPACDAKQHGMIRAGIGPMAVEIGDQRAGVAERLPLADAA